MIPTLTNRSRLWLALAGSAVISAASARSSLAQVLWEPVRPQQADESQVLVPAHLHTPIVWEPVPVPEEHSSSSPVMPEAVVWEAVPVPGHETLAGDSTTINTSVVWEPVPNSEAIAVEESITVLVEQQRQMNVPELPPPPKLQALNRSIAYSDGQVGPDIGWKIPNGFRWSERWFADVSSRGFSRRRDGEDFWAWNNGDATAQINANIIQSGQWSIGVNTSIRSVYQGDQADGGSTRIGEGVSSGFRIATALGESAGLAFGGEQILQWDSYTDTGRNFYLMASKGWWIGSSGKDFPLLIANGGIGTGRWAVDPNLQFACINNVQNRSGTYAVDNNLCWSPIGTLSLVMNEWWGMFIEYNSAHAVVAASANLTGGIPLRLTWGVRYPTAPQFGEVSLPDDLTWVFRASFGF